MTDVAKPGIFSRSAVWALLCAALILLAGFAQVNHVHQDRSGTSHECSLCSVAHAGAIVSAAFQLSPFSAPTLLVYCLEASPLPLLVAAFLSIRPPPSIEQTLTTAAIS
jgi:hypothetical protein